MFKKIGFTVALVMMCFLGNAQKTINDYKYVIIPKSFDFSKSEDQYQLNSLLKFLFNKYGYEAYFLDELPEDLKTNRCLGLMAEVSNEEGSMFKTKLEIILKDCFDSVVITSKIGESRLKAYSKAYSQAMRDAFETFQNLNYKYVPQEETIEIQKKDTQPLKKIIKAEEKATVAKLESRTIAKTKEIKTQPLKHTTPELYYAQAIKNGFQIVNAEPKVVMILLTTSAKDVFMVKGENAIVYLKDGAWLYSENDGTEIKDSIVNIKF